MTRLADLRVHLGCDHAGFTLKGELVRWLTQHGFQPVDHGPKTLDPSDDYPPYCLRAAAAVVADPGSMGVVIGGSGNGEAIAANKVAGVRAALAWNEETARLARLHNDANVLSLGARMTPPEEATRLVEVFLTSQFTGEPRHRRRIAMLADYELSGRIPPVPGSPS